MLIRWIIVLFGVSVGSCLPLDNNSTTTPTYETTKGSSGKNESEQRIKPKRELDEFDFDSSITFDDLPTLFPIKKMSDLSTFDEDDMEDMSGFIPNSFKVARSNGESLGTHGQTYESPGSPPPNYHSGAHLASQTSNSQANLYSNEDTDALSHVRQNNAAYNNQVTTPMYIDTFVTQPKYASAKSSNAYATEAQYKIQPAKVQYNPYQSPVYAPLAQVALHPIVANNHQVQTSASHNTAYKTPLVHGYKNVHPAAKIYAPLHAHNQQQQQQQQFDNQFQNFAHNLYDNIQYTTTPALELTNKKLELPVIQLQTAQNYPGYIQAIETTPLVFNTETGLQYKSDNAYGLEFIKPKTTHQANSRSGTNSPFLGHSNPVQVLPVQTASSTAQFPKFKGASIAQFPSRGFSKIPNDYQEFKSQPQLHFDGNRNNNKKSYHQPGFYIKPLEEIRTDVEVINKKKPKPPKTDEEEEEENPENESEEGFKKTDSYFPKSEDEDDEVESIPIKYFKESELEGEFKPSKAYVFEEYDDKFNKQKKPKANEEAEEEEEEDASINLAAKYRYLGKAEDEEDEEEEEDKSAEEKRPSKHKSYSPHKHFQSSKVTDDDEDEEETQKQVKREKLGDREHHGSRKNKGHKERTKSYVDDFEEAFRRKHIKPKHNHRHSKGSKTPKSSESSERPEISSSFSRPQKKNRHRAYRDESGEPSSRQSSLSGPTRQTFKRDYRSEESDKDKESINGKTLPQVVWQDSYGMRVTNPDDDVSRSSYSKEESAVTDSYGHSIKSSTTAIPDLTTKSAYRSSTRSPQNDGDIGSSSTFSPRGNWKSSSTQTRSNDESYNKPTGSGVKALVNSKQQSYFSPILGRGEYRNLKGI